jgi:TolB-like protein
MRATRSASTVGAALALAGVLAWGCAGPARWSGAAEPPLARRPAVAVLPLENLSGTLDAGDAMTHIVLTHLAAAGFCEVRDLGDVEKRLREIRMRNTASPTTEQLRALGDSLHVAYVLCGTLLEQGMVRTPDGEVPAVGVTLKLVDVATARIRWARMMVKTGEDRETVFGLGRQLDATRVAGELAEALVRDLAQLAGPPPRGEP